jgi:hypothetical protein
MHYPCRETFPQENLLQEVPVDPVIGLLEIKFKKQALLLSHSEFMCNLVESQSALMQTSPFDES